MAKNLLNFTYLPSRTAYWAQQALGKAITALTGRDKSTSTLDLFLIKSLKVILHGNLELQLYPCHYSFNFTTELFFEVRKMVIGLSWVFAKCSVIH